MSLHIHCGALVLLDIIWTHVCDLELDPMVELTWKETAYLVSYFLFAFVFFFIGTHQTDKTLWDFFFYLEGHELKGTCDGSPACKNQDSPDDRHVSSKPLCVSRQETWRNASTSPSGCSSSRGSSSYWHTFAYTQTCIQAMNWHKTYACA